MATAVKTRTTSKALGFAEVEPKKRNGTATTKPKKATTTIQDEWDKKLQTPRSNELLAQMAAKARADHQAGKTERGGFGK